MADAPKDKKDKKPEASSQSVEQKIVVFLGVAVLISLIVIPAILSFFNVGVSGISTSSIKEFFINIISKTFVFITFIAVFLSLVFALAISYAKSRHAQIMNYWQQTTGGGAGKGEASGLSGAAGTNIAGTGVLLPGSGQVAAVHGPQAQGGNEKWLDIESKINSANPGDWRLAILEADIVLFEMLDQMGLPGASLGEKLKAADTSFFSTINEAWQAHKIRNVIAHEGASYQLSYNEAKRAIDLYRRVFEEFYFI